MFVSKLHKTPKQRITRDFWEVLDLGRVCSVQIFDKDEDYPREVNPQSLVRDIEEHLENMIEQTKDGEESLSHIERPTMTLDD